jgi:hypothetical protein
VNRLLWGVLVGVALLWQTDANAETRRYALVTAWNLAADPKVEPLEFADDDAARYAELFDAIADQVEVHAVLDQKTQALFPAIARRARPPAKIEMKRTLEAMFEKMRADRAAGHEVVFYFVLIGHGEVGPGGEGFVTLFDGPLSRADLFRDVIARSPASVNHVLIDACNSYFVVKRRGGGDDGAPSRAAEADAFIAEADLSRYPTTGVLVSTSGAKESHEWGALGAGVFSHEIRSALTGAADADGDGRVSYAEVRAFVAAANLRVSESRARVDLYASAPAIDATRPLVDLRAARFAAYATLPSGPPLHVYVEDDRGVRYADVHASGETAMHVGLIGRPYYFVRTPDHKSEERIVTSRKRQLVSAAGFEESGAVRARGAVDEALRKNLFGEPYGPTFLRGYASANNLPFNEADRGLRWEPPHALPPPAKPPAVKPRPEERRPDLVARPSDMPATRVVGLTLLGTGALSAGTGVFAYLQARSAQADFDDHLDEDGNVVGLSLDEAAALEHKARRWATARNALLIGGGAAIATGVVLILLPGPRGKDKSVTVGLSPSGAFVRGTF